MTNQSVWAAIAAMGALTLAAPASAAPAASGQMAAPAIAQPAASDAATPEAPLAGQAPMAEVAGVRIVPSVIAHDVNLTPSAWYLRSLGNTASASARIYTDRQGAITGLTMTAWGLPNPESINPMDHQYVVWLFNPDTNQMKNLGVIDSFNGGKAVFGYEPERPLVGYSRIVITPEMAMGTKWPTGWQQLDGAINQTAVLAPIGEPMQAPMNAPMQAPMAEPMQHSR